MRDGQTDGRTDGVKPIYTLTTLLGGGINIVMLVFNSICRYVPLYLTPKNDVIMKSTFSVIVYTVLKRTDGQSHTMIRLI